VERVTPRWEESDLGAEERESPFVDEPLAQRAWAEQAAEWIITLGALLDAEGTPLEAEDWSDKGKRKPGGDKRRDSRDDWIVRRVTLSEEGRTRVASRTQTPTEAPSPRENLASVETWVRGYLRRQPHGPGRSLRKWVYITEHQARRWVSTRPVRVDVDT